MSPLSFVTTALGRFKDVKFTKHSPTFSPHLPPLELRGGGGNSTMLGDFSDRSLFFIPDIHLVQHILLNCHNKRGKMKTLCFNLVQNYVSVTLFLLFGYIIHIN